jgi:putative transposase
MGRCSFDKNVTFVWQRDGQRELFKVEDLLVGGRALVKNLSLGDEPRPYADTDLRTAWARGEIIFAHARRNTPPSQPGLPPTGYTFADFSGLPEKMRNEAWRRYNIIRPYLKMSRAERGAALQTAKQARSVAFKVALGAAGGESDRRGAPRSKMGEADSPSAIKRWLKDFRDSGGDVRSLVPLAEGKPGGRGTKRLSPAVEDIIDVTLARQKILVEEGVINRVSPGVLLADIVDRVEKENKGIEEHGEPPRLTYPVRNTVLGRVRSSGLAHILNRPLSELEAHRDEQTQVGPRPTRVYERVELDHSPIDLIVVDEVDYLPIGRPEATYALDACSRYMAGFHIAFEPVSAQSVLTCVEHCIIPEIPGHDVRTLYGTEHAKQSYGIMETLFIDNERCNVAKSVFTACKELDINVEQASLGKPWLKGRIEKFIKTKHEGLLSYFPGATFANIVQRGDYDPMKTACITLKALKQIVNIWLWDDYAERKHRGARGIPARLWEAGALLYPPPLTHSAEHVHVVLMDATDSALQHYGIDLHSLVYQSPALRILRQRLKLAKTKTVRVKYHREDIGQINVLDPFEERWITVPVVDEKGTGYGRGLSLWKHQYIRDYARTTEPKEDLPALARAKMAIQAIVEEEFFRKGGKSTRKFEARFRQQGGVSAPTSASNTPDLPAPALPTPPALPAPDEPTRPDASPVTPPEPLVQEPAGIDEPPPSRRRAEKPRAARPAPMVESPPPPRDRAGWGGGYDMPGGVPDHDDDTSTD